MTARRRAVDDGSADAGETPVLSVESLKRHFSQDEGILDRLLGGTGRVRAVDGVDLQVHEGEVLAVVGESGCGKSTLAETIVGLNEPTAGSVHYRGEPVDGLSDRAMRPHRADIQMVFQDPLASLNPRRTVEEILTAPLRVHGIGDDADERAEIVRDALEEVGLEREVATRYPHQFSGGQQQRIAIARSLTVDPDLLIADEPVSSLDVSVQAQILGLLERLRRERDIAMVFIAHDLSVVKHVADRVAVMYLGEIVESAPAERLFADPAHPYTKSLLSAAPRIGASGDGFTERVTLRGTPPSPVEPPSGCRFHTRCPALIPPEDWRGTQEQFLDVFQLRTRLEAGEVDVGAIEDRLRSEGETVTSVAVARRIRTDHLDADPSTIPEEARRTLLAATDVYVEAGAAAAADELSGVFETPCERAVPAETTVERDHVAACHRVDPDRPGAPDHLDV
jgi:peptide/nickel transport system ATP-binding protein